MIAARVEGVDFIVANTDAQALNASACRAARRIQLGTQIRPGSGRGFAARGRRVRGGRPRAAGPNTLVIYVPTRRSAPAHRRVGDDEIDPRAAPRVCDGVPPAPPASCAASAADIDAHPSMQRANGAPCMRPRPDGGPAVRIPVAALHCDAGITQGGRAGGCFPAENPGARPMGILRHRRGGREAMENQTRERRGDRCALGQAVQAAVARRARRGWRFCAMVGDADQRRRRADRGRHAQCPADLPSSHQRCWRITAANARCARPLPDSAPAPAR